MEFESQLPLHCSCMKARRLEYWARLAAPSAQTCILLGSHGCKSLQDFWQPRRNKPKLSEQSPQRAGFHYFHRDRISVDPITFEGYSPGRGGNQILQSPPWSLQALQWQSHLPSARGQARKLGVRTTLLVSQL